MRSQKKLNTVVDNTVFRKLIEHSDEIITLIDKDFNVIYRSLATERITGYHIGEGRHFPVMDLLYKKDRPALAKVFEEISKTLGLSKTITLPLRHFDGHPVWFECKFKNMLQDDDVQAIVCISKDITKQRIINEKLEREQRHLRLLESVIINAKDSILITSAEPQQEPGPKILFVNEAFTAMTGYDLAEVVGQSPRFLQGPKTDANALKRMREAIQQWEPCEITIVNYKKNGEEFWVNLSISPVLDIKGNYTHWIAIQRDITEKKELEDLLHKSTNLAGIGGWNYDLVHRKVYWSPITCEIYEVDSNYQPSLREGIEIYKNPQDWELMQHHINMAVKKGESFDVEMEIITAKKNIKWVRIIGEPEMVGKYCFRVRGSFQDIDVRKKAEILAAEALAQKNHILESIGDGFFAVDKDWVVTYWNSKAEEELKYTKAEMLNHKLGDVFDGFLKSDSYKKYLYALKHDSAVHFEDYYSKLQKWFGISAYPSVDGLSVYFKDITARKVSEKLLIESEKRYSELFQLSPLPQWVFDVKTLKFLDVNAAAIYHYGYTRKEFLGITIKEIRPVEEIPKLEHTLKIAKTKKEFTSQGVFMHRKKNGEMIQVEIQSNLITYKGKQAKIIIINDITERLTYINAIEAQNEKLKEVSWIQSHVFRAPLSRSWGL
jgi:PAS domain S-box-containing protein